MVDSEALRFATEQMSRIPPDELRRMSQQMMNNPDLIRMAAESMKDLKADDIRFATEQMKRLRPEDMAEMSSRLANASPEEIAAMRVQADAQQAYEYRGSLALKNQGNHLHGIGKYSEAIEKYHRAKQNLLALRTPEAAALRQACSLNLMSCYLKTGQFEKTIAEGVEVLGSDANNLKALYRRGQAYKELGNLRLAIADLSKAAKLSPDDETVSDALKKLQEQVEIEGEAVDDDCIHSPAMQNGPIIEEISESEVEILSVSTTSSQEVNQNPSHPSRSEQVIPNTIASSQTFDNLKQNPEMIRGMHSIMGSLQPEQIAAMSGGKMTPEMAKLATDMVKQMSADEMQDMFGMISSFENQSTANATPITSQSTSTTSGSTSTASRSTSRQDNQDLRPGSMANTPDFSSISSEMQEQMKQHMKNPMMTQMMSSMMQNMSPESMVAMSEQMGFKISPEEAEKAKAAMANLSPHDLERMMKWADRAQKVVNVARKGKDFVLGRSGLIFAIIILIIAVLLHWLGVIGS